MRKSLRKKRREKKRRRRTNGCCLVGRNVIGPGCSFGLTGIMFPAALNLKNPIRYREYEKKVCYAEKNVLGTVRRT